MIDYNKFLATPEDVRFFLQKPFLVDGGAAFTNGHMFVFAEGLTPDDVSNPPDNVVANINEWSKEAMSADKYLALPEIDWSLFTCDECGGSGKHNFCLECSGAGFVDFENDYNDYTIECMSCEENPEHKCRACSGIGIGGLGMKRGLPAAYLNGVVSVDAGYLKMISELPGLLIVPPASKESMTQFRFDGGCGAVMPLKAYADSKLHLIELLEPAQ